MTFDRKAYMREYKRRPEVREKDRVYMKRYRDTPEHKQHAKEYQRIWSKSPKGVEYYKRYRQEYPRRPEIQEREIKRSHDKYMESRWNSGDHTTVNRKPDYINGNSFCSKCRISVPKTKWCANCGMRMRMKSRYNKGEVHRY